VPPRELGLSGGTAMLGAVVVLALLLCACARPAPPPLAEAPPPTRDDLYVVVPGPDGTTGAVSITTPSQQLVLDTPYAAARVREGGRVEGGTTTEDEVRHAFAAALAAQPARPASFALYFVEGRDEVTPESQHVLQQVFAEIARRPDPEITVIGHTDRVGALAANDALSRRRAERVRDALVKLGIAASRIEVSGRGEREPLVPTEDEVAEPRNRRVEISIR
jgi:outer membrane protein OmpA-like peptidoglycan-associated protein